MERWGKQRPWTSYNVPTHRPTAVAAEGRASSTVPLPRSRQSSPRRPPPNHELQRILFSSLSPPRPHLRLPGSPAQRTMHRGQQRRAADSPPALTHTPSLTLYGTLGAGLSLSLVSVSLRVKICVRISTSRGAGETQMRDRSRANTPTGVSDSYQVK